MTKLNYSKFDLHYDKEKDRETEKDIIKGNDTNTDKYSKIDKDSKADKNNDSSKNKRFEFDPINTPYAIAGQIQKTVDELLINCPDVDWNENLITFKLIESLRNILLNYKLPGILDDFDECKFNFEAYKLTGKAEESHGDIAIIVTRKFPNSREPVSGVAFYEAKASGNGNYAAWQFPSFCIQQLRRLVTNTPKLNYLFYSKQSRKVGSSDWPVIENPNYYGDDLQRNGSYANAVTIDANFLKNCRDIDLATRTVGLPFGTQFVNRILSGRDLDYSRSVEKTINRWLKYTRKASPFIVSVSIQEEFDEDISYQLELPGFEKLKFPEFFSESKKLES